MKRKKGLQNTTRKAENFVFFFGTVSYNTESVTGDWLIFISCFQKIDFEHPERKGDVSKKLNVVPQSHVDGCSLELLHGHVVGKTVAVVVHTQVLISN